MKYIDIDDIMDEKGRDVYCFLCGTLSMSSEEINECKHLYYIYHSDGGEPIYDRDNIYENIVADKNKEFLDNLNDKYVCISVSGPVLAPFTVYYIYETDKEKKWILYKRYH